MNEGLEQLDAHDYAVELRASGVQKIQQMAIAFDGKRVMVLPKGAPKLELPKAAAKKSAKKSAPKATKAAKRSKR
jgi:hypothetical protein